jgi:ATP synthase protein I
MPAMKPDSLPRPPVYRVLLAQSVVLVLCATAMYFVDAVTAKSILLGGMVFLVPHSWFAWRVFRFSGAGAARKVVQGFYRAEAGKFLLSCAAFASVFILVRPLDAVAFFCAYIVLYVANGVFTARLKGV